MQLQLAARQARISQDWEATRPYLAAFALRFGSTPVVGSSAYSSLHQLLKIYDNCCCLYDAAHSDPLLEVITSKRVYVCMYDSLFPNVNIMHVYMYGYHACAACINVSRMLV